MRPLTRFIGRDKLLAEIEARLLCGDRLLSLVGPPGVGKTRLAQRFSELYEDGGRGGVLRVDLTEAHTGADLSALVARALGLTSSPRNGLALALARNAPLLLVLDNFEGLPPGTAELVRGWLEGAPGLAALVTSRVRLGLSGEVALEIGPLALPDTSTHDPAALRTNEAVLLFEERARAVRGTSYTDAEVPAIAALVRELDGLPLAIELAAARAHLLSPRELSARLGRRFEILGRSGPDRRERHATLEAAIDGSWFALSEVEQEALARTAVFAGGFTLEAAEALLQDLPALECLTALRDRSLITAELGPDGTRFHLLASIRAYARARLEASGRASAVIAAQVRLYAGAAAPHAERVFRSGDAASRAWLTAELENLSAAARNGTGTDAVDAALALDLVNLERSASERIASLSSAEGRAGPNLDRVRQAKLLLTIGKIQGSHGLAEIAIQTLSRAAALAEAEDQRAIWADALNQLAVRQRQRGQYAAAEEMGRRALALVAGTHHPRVEAEVTACLGLLYGELDRTEDARAHDQAALGAFVASGDRASEGLALGNLAQLAQAAGDFEAAESFYDRAVSAFRAVKDASFEGIYLGLWAEMLHERGDLDLAKEAYDRALSLLERTEVLHLLALLKGARAALDADLGRTEAAERGFHIAETEAERAGVAAYREAIGVHRGHLDLAEDRRAEAWARLEGLSFRETSEAVRTARRMLDRRLRGEGVRARLRVASDGAWFERDGAARVALARRGALRRILLALAQGGPKSADALLAAGWPKETVLPEAASKRVRVAIATLRRLGLSTSIQTRDDGYILDPSLHVVWC